MGQVFRYFKRDDQIEHLCERECNSQVVGNKAVRGNRELRSIHVVAVNPKDAADSVFPKRA